MRCYSHTAGTCKCWTLPPIVVRTWGNSSYDSNLVSRIIKITHAHNLHVKMLEFAPSKICTWRNAYCLRDYFAQTVNKSPPLLTPAIKLCIFHYFTSNRMIVCWNTDFYSSHVIPPNETISNYFVNWLLPSLFANAKVTYLYLAIG